MKTGKLQWKNGIFRVTAIVVCLMGIVLLENRFALVCRAQTATVTTESAKIREEANTTSNSPGSVKQGESVTIIEEVKGSDGKTWYKVESANGISGYIRSDLVEKGGTALTGGEQPAAGDKSSGTVLKDGVRVRSEADAGSDMVATVGRGVKVAVTGNTKGTDGKTWYSVSFTYNNKEVTGYIRADFLTFDAIPEDEPAVTEINGAMGEGDEGTAVPETTEPASEEPQPDPVPEDEPAQNPTDYQLKNVEETVKVPKGYTQIELEWNNEKIRSWKNGDYYIFYAVSPNGNEGWYRFDSQESTYQRYDPEIEAASGGMGSQTQTILLIVLGVVVVILIVIVTILFIKLNDHKQEHDWDDDDDDDDDDNGDKERARKEKAKHTWRALNFLTSDDDDDDDEDDEEYDEDDEEEEFTVRPAVRSVRPVGRPAAPQRTTVPNGAARRPAPRPEGAIQQRPAQPNGTVRRPAPNGGPRPSAPARPEGARPAAPQRTAVPQRPMSNGEVRRPASARPEGTPVQRPSAPNGTVRRPAARPEGTVPQRPSAPNGGAKRPAPRPRRDDE